MACALLVQVALGQSALTEHHDLLYVPTDAVEADSVQRLNLVLPTDVEQPPLLLWIGGGAWSYVNRAMEMDIARRMAAEGMAVASVGHRLSAAVWQNPALDEGVQHPAHIEDIASAA